MPPRARLVGVGHSKGLIKGLAVAGAVALVLSVCFWLIGIKAVPPVSKTLRVEPVPEPPLVRLCSDEVEQVLKSLLVRHKTAGERMRSSCTFERGLGLGWGMQFGTVHARILAVHYPEETETFALKIADDPGAEDTDLQFAAKVLGMLATRGSRDSLAVLVRLAQGSNANVLPIALECVLSCDPEGTYQALYVGACRRRILEAFDSGPYWVDDPTNQAFQEILKQSLTKYDDDYYSRETLERLRILESPQRSALLEQLIEGVPPGGVWTRGWSEWRQLWALKVVRREPTLNTLVALRHRLDRMESQRSRYASIADVGPTHPGWPASRDYDEYLIAYMELGGQLNQPETERLTYFGYLGDANGRLRELLAHWCR